MLGLSACVRAQASRARDPSGRCGERPSSSQARSPPSPCPPSLPPSTRAKAWPPPGFASELVRPPRLCHRRRPHAGGLLGLASHGEVFFARRRHGGGPTGARKPALRWTIRWTGLGAERRMELPERPPRWAPRIGLQAAPHSGSRQRPAGYVMHPWAVSNKKLRESRVGTCPLPNRKRSGPAPLEEHRRPHARGWPGRLGKKDARGRSSARPGATVATGSAPRPAGTAGNGAKGVGEDQYVDRREGTGRAAERTFNPHRTVREQPLPRRTRSSPWSPHPDRRRPIAPVPRGRASKPHQRPGRSHLSGTTATSFRPRGNCLEKVAAGRRRRAIRRGVAPRSAESTRGGGRRWDVGDLAVVSGPPRRTGPEASRPVRAFIDTLQGAVPIWEARVVRGRRP